MPTPSPTGSIYSAEPNQYNRYDVGVMAVLQPSERKFKHMFYIVAYDITEPNRLRRVAKTCEAYGARIEKSVFQCDITKELFERFWRELTALVDDDTDAIVAYRICGGCLEQAESIGIPSSIEKPLCYIL